MNMLIILLGIPVWAQQPSACQQVVARANEALTSIARLEPRITGKDRSICRDPRIMKLRTDFQPLLRNYIVETAAPGAVGGCSNTLRAVFSRLQSLHTSVAEMCSGHIVSGFVKSPSTGAFTGMPAFVTLDLCRGPVPENLRKQNGFGNYGSC